MIGVHSEPREQIDHHVHERVIESHSEPVDLHDDLRFVQTGEGEREFHQIIDVHRLDLHDGVDVLRILHRHVLASHAERRYVVRLLQQNVWNRHFDHRSFPKLQKQRSIHSHTTLSRLL